MIAAFVPKHETRKFCQYMNAALGDEMAFVMHIRQQVQPKMEKLYTVNKNKTRS